MLHTDRTAAGSRAIVVAEDDTALREVLEIALAAKGYTPIGLAGGTSLLESVRQCQPACVVVDLYMPDVGGLELLTDLSQQAPGVPVLAMSGFGNIPIAVDTIRRGALDFLEKPFSVSEFLARVEAAIAARPSPVRAPAPATPSSRLRTLTQREHEVLGHIALGASSKEVGRSLGISPRTVDVHRARIMEKLQARRAIDLVRIVFDRGLPMPALATPAAPAE